jgi:hypothetical protein
MTYDEFLNNFLNKFEEIRSFAGKIKFANEYLSRIGSGSGRVVYDIDGEKVLKIAKNAKGIAQNGEEANIGNYDDTRHIVAKVFKSPDDDSYLISEKGKKVNERRIKELTKIPSLHDLHSFLMNYTSQNNGGRKIFDQDKEVEQFLWDNEFAYDLAQFISNYSQSAGDMGRPSTYGEVLRDGQPAIVLTDYGLSDEVYNSHYSPQRKQKYSIYEIDDLEEMLIPINENLMNFILKRDKYPSKTINNIGELSDKFHECVDNVKEYLNVVENKKQFYNNLLALQEYLISENYYSRDRLNEENEIDIQQIPKVQKWSALDKNRAIELAIELTERLKLSQPKFLGGGSLGFAFEINPNLVLKITTDPSEADSALKIMKSNPKHLAKTSNVYKIYDSQKDLSYFALLQENVPNKPVDNFRRFNKIFNIISPNDISYNDFVDLIRSRQPNFEQLNQIVNLILTYNQTVNVSENTRKEVHDFFLQLVEIRKELVNLGVKSVDFINPENLGYKDNVLKYFDIGGYRAEEPTLPDDSLVVVEEEYLKEEFDKEYFSQIANKIAEIKKYPQLESLGSGDNGSAYDIGNNKILKITSDKSEAAENLKLKGKKLNYIAEPYEIYSIKSKVNQNSPEVYVIVLEKLRTDRNYFHKQYERLKYVFSLLGIDFFDVVDYYYYKNQGFYDNNEKIQKKIMPYFEKNPKDWKFFESLLKISEEVERNNIDSMDFLNPDNLGFKPNGDIAFFDVGFGDANMISKPEELTIDENKRVLSSMKGSSTVEVKKKCRLGGLGNTSAQCNKGDIKNLNIKPLNETIVPNRTFWGWVSPELEFYEVPKLNHKDFIMRQYKKYDFGWDYDRVFDQAMKDGWVRVVYENEPNLRRFYSELFLYGNDEEHVIYVLKTLFYDLVKYGNNKIFVDWENNKSSKVFTTDNSENKADFFDYLFENITNEGVADKYAEKEFNIEPKFTKFEKQYKKQQNIENEEEVVGQINSIGGKSYNLKNSDCNIPLLITPEIKDYLLKFDSDEKLLRSGGLPTELLDNAAFGFNDKTLTQLLPKQLSIKWKDDYENVLYEVQKSGLSKLNWAKKIDLSQPIDVSFDGKKFYIEDGHHRYFAAKVLNKPLKINLEIKANPVIKLGGDLGYDNYHRCIWKQAHEKNNELDIMNEEKPQKISLIWLNKLWNFLSPKHRNNQLYKKWYEKSLNGTITDKEWQHFNYLLKNGDSMYNKSNLTKKN